MLLSVHKKLMLYIRQLYSHSPKSVLNIASAYMIKWKFLSESAACDVENYVLYKIKFYVVMFRNHFIYTSHVISLAKIMRFF